MGGYSGRNHARTITGLRSHISGEKRDGIDIGTLRADGMRGPDHVSDLGDRLSGRLEGQRRRRRHTALRAYQNAGRVLGLDRATPGEFEQRLFRHRRDSPATALEEHDGGIPDRGADLPLLLGPQRVEDGPAHGAAGHPLCQHLGICSLRTRRV